MGRAAPVGVPRSEEEVVVRAAAALFPIEGGAVAFGTVDIFGAGFSLSHVEKKSSPSFVGVFTLRGVNSSPSICIP